MVNVQRSMLDDHSDLLLFIYMHTVGSCNLWLVTPFYLPVCTGNKTIYTREDIDCVALAKSKTRNLLEVFVCHYSHRCFCWAECLAGNCKLGVPAQWILMTISIAVQDKKYSEICTRTCLMRMPYLWSHAQLSD